MDVAVDPVWKFVELDDNPDMVIPDTTLLPAKHAEDRIFASRVTLANGERRWALFGNIDASSARQNSHFMTVSIEHDGGWIYLARYHDLGYDEAGPSSLAGKLGLEITDVFPITYDLRNLIVGESAALSGEIVAEPKERLTRAELIALALQ